MLRRPRANSLVADLRVSQNGGTPKWIGFEWKAVLKWMIWGTPHFRKLPFWWFQPFPTKIHHQGRIGLEWLPGLLHVIQLLVDATTFPCESWELQIYWSSFHFRAVKAIGSLLKAVAKGILRTWPIKKCWHSFCSTIWWPKTDSFPRLSLRPRTLRHVVWLSMTITQRRWGAEIYVTGDIKNNVWGLVLGAK